MQRADRVDAPGVGPIVPEQPAPAVISARVPAAGNQLDWAVDNAGRLDELATRRPYVDDMLAEIAKKQGTAGPPQVVDPEIMDRAVQEGWTELWRGVQSGSQPGQPNAAQRAEILRTGPFQPGAGIYGHGVYTSVWREAGEAYAGLGSYNPGELMRLALDPRARIIDYAKLRREMTAWQKRFLRQHGYPNEAAFREAAIADPALEDLWVSWVNLADPGRYAAARGYDAIRIVDMSDGYVPMPDGTWATQYVILNRTVLHDPA